MTDPRHHIAFMIFVAIAILVAGRVYRMTRPPSPAEELAPLREELALFRAAADSCNDRYSEMEEAFLGFGAEVDSMRGRVDHLESLDPDGVPGERYAEYLEVFDAYNHAVPLWEGRADSLERQRERCRSLTEQHNELADSARVRLIELGRWPEDTTGVAPGAANAEPGSPQ